MGDKFRPQPPKKKPKLYVTIALSPYEYSFLQDASRATGLSIREVARQGVMWAMKNREKEEGEY